MQQFYMTQSIPMLIAAARRRIKQIAWEHVRSCGVTPQQASVMLALAQQDGVSLTQLARGLHLDNPTASRIVNALVKRALVVTREDPSDKRRSRLMLTASGRRLGKNLAERADTVATILEGKLEARDTAQLRTLLLRFVERLETSPETKPPRPARIAKRAKRGGS